MQKPIGRWVVFYGMSGGDPEPVDPRALMDSSTSLTGGDLWSYLTSAENRRSRAARLLAMFADGSLRMADPVRFEWSDGRSAHEFLESGRSAGEVLMIS